ncbi:hypothetical protein [Bacillus sp. 165]|uniref:SWIM zinc finger family protein n=1 Tax=Bacillus sp. 165 TaxID=1529117 RepID=UPI001ADBDC71|nr:hypothetical protein [Bacillus sp. 165]MBO9129174.1 hypothetical protein [Bacillus sp. 165]
MNIQQLKKEMKSCIPPHIIERGLDYYEEGYVSEITLQNNIVYSLVEGNYGDYEVKIDLKQFIYSECECPYENHCKHMAAVVFAIDKKGLLSVPTAAISDVLNRLEKAELVSILEQLVHRKSEYKDIIAVMLEKMKKME